MFRFVRQFVESFIRLLYSRRDLMLENLVLRQQLVVFKSRNRRPKLATADKLFLVLARRFWAGWRNALCVVTPETVIRWHRAGFRLYSEMGVPRQRNRGKTSLAIGLSNSQVQLGQVAPGIIRIDRAQGPAEERFLPRHIEGDSRHELHRVAHKQVALPGQAAADQARIRWQFKLDLGPGGIDGGRYITGESGCLAQGGIVIDGQFGQDRRKGVIPLNIGRRLS